MYRNPQQWLASCYLQLYHHAPNLGHVLVFAVWLSQLNLKSCFKTLLSINSQKTHHGVIWTVVRQLPRKANYRRKLWFLKLPLQRLLHSPQVFRKEHYWDSYKSPLKVHVRTWFHFAVYGQYIRIKLNSYTLLKENLTHSRNNITSKNKMKLFRWNCQRNGE